LRELAKKDRAALTALGLALRGRGDENAEEARKALQAAADQGEPHALVALAWLRLAGNDRDRDAARALFVRAVAAGDLASAHVGLAWLDDRSSSDAAALLSAYRHYEAASRQSRLIGLEAMAVAADERRAALAFVLWQQLWGGAAAR
jgi:hypothetical protein